MRHHAAQTNFDLEILVLDKSIGLGVPTLYLLWMFYYRYTHRYEYYHDSTDSIGASSATD